MDITDAEIGVRKMEGSKFKQLCFNELTLHPFCESQTDLYNRVVQYAKTLRAAQDAIGTKKVSYAKDLSGIQIEEHTSLRDFCSKYRRCPEMISILSTFTMPQVNPDDGQKTEMFTDTIASINEGKELSDGLAAAYVNDVPSIGFASNDYWNAVMHAIMVVSGDREIVVNWPCLTVPGHLQCESFRNWAQEHSEIALQETTLTYEEKIADIDGKLRDDHGKDILKEHAMRLCHCEYVEGILCSRPFAPKHRTYVKSVFNDGSIDLVLFWDDRGLSMRVKTTGRNIQETAAIVALLQEKYCR